MEKFNLISEKPLWALENFGKTSFFTRFSYYRKYLMETSIIENICGKIPEGFEKVTPTGSSYIFENDPNFLPINLNDFLGRAATVNSFTECFYYVELGFGPGKTTIFDYGLYIAGLGLIGFLIYKTIKNKIFQKLYKKTRYSDKGNDLKFVKSKKVKNFLIALFLPTQAYFLYDIVRTKALRIPSFIDEYITITSNVNFFKSLDFNAGNFIGGNYSVHLTSGPISAIGSVLGWNITNKFIIARLSNFLWIIVIQLIFVYLIQKIYKVDVNFLILTTGFLMVLIPWWQGSLYSIGEIPSMLIFTNAIFLFPKYRKLSLILFSVSIIYGKLLNLVLFAGFFIAKQISEKDLKKMLNDLLILFIPLVPWLALVHFKYENGNAINYLLDQFNFVLNHQTSGVNEESLSFIDSFISSLNNSEFVNWNFYDRTRLVLIPLIFIIILLRNKNSIDSFFGNITIPIFSSVSFIYLWFWFLNSTKWMRHTQHFTVIVLVVCLYLINFKVLTRKVDLILTLSLLSFYIENNKNLIYLSIIVYFMLIYFTNTNKSYTSVKILFLLILLIDISLPYFEKEKAGDIHETIEECSLSLISDECRNKYLEN